MPQNGSMKDKLNDLTFFINNNTNFMNNKTYPRKYY